MKTRSSLVVLLAVTLLLLTGSSVFAGMHKWMVDVGLEDKVMMKLHMIFEHKDDIGLTDKQMDQIKVLKIAMKKELIRKNADIEIVALDINVMLYDDKIDTDKINVMIGQKYELKKAKTKLLVKAYAGLKDILTAKQKDQLKEIYRSMKKDMGGSCDGKCKGSSKMMHMKKH